MIVDINEQLTIKCLYKQPGASQTKPVPLADFKAETDLDDIFFLKTLRSIEQKELVTIGFLQRGFIVKVKNWYEKYPDVQDFHIKLTKSGIKVCNN
ncbi:MAG: hypothetical protein PQJ61_07250 [Spirochaetales bacterium]|uniref:Uncharacterized protein n=1 Tax=Candidatus Thalassospirochaeta sargassi TaxID=3119039 RepID=A0AAJ1IFR8_9SPIO|nr:hypothetical protein [Spirochaetales bacterium]